MIFEQLALPGVVRIDPERRVDERGFFSRTFCVNEFAERGLETRWVQANMSWTRIAGTIRGMHFQTGAAAEDKLIRCVRGAVFDVLVDLRPVSPSKGRWIGVRLDADNQAQVYVPKGIAHGFQTLTDDVEMMYLHSQIYSPHADHGIRYDDGDIGIDWPLPVTMVSQRDASHPSWRDWERQS